jgi:predicted secreted hydrolase
MKSSCFRVGLALFLVLQLCAATSEPFRLAAPGYRFAFPRDHFSHPEFQTEWWYYTGNLRTPEGRRFGFELTFFRQGLDQKGLHQKAVDRTATPPAVWEVRDLWLAHLALSDLDGSRFLHTERLNRSGAGIAGADAAQARVWNGNWQAQWKLDPRAPGAMMSQQLRAVADHFSFELAMTTAKPPVIHGENGISQKAEGPGRASHYISFTRLLTSGVIVIEGQRFNVEGQSWMDHEFFTHQLAANQSGWDWFSLQFEDGSEIMLFQLRRKDGAPDPFSAGTYIDPQGRTTHLSAKDFSLTSGKTWTSPSSGGRYPIEWSIRVPSLALDAALTSRLAQQELTGKRSAPTYWEGAVEVMAARKGQPLKGVGYLEMTGYAGPVPMAE